METARKAIDLWPALRAVGDNGQSRNAEVIVSVVRNQWSAIEHRSRSDPGVGALDPVACRLGGKHDLGPLLT